MVRNFGACTSYNATSHLQSRLTGKSQHQSCFATRSRANRLCHSRFQTRSKPGTLQIDQRPHGADNGDSAAQIRSCSERFNVLTVFVWNRPLVSPAHFADISVPKLFRACQFLNVLECKSNFRYRHANWIFATVWCTFRRPIFQKRSAELSLQSCARFVGNFPKSTPLLPRPHKPRFTPNNAGFRAQTVITREFTRSRSLSRVCQLFAVKLGWREASKSKNIKMICSDRAKFVNVFIVKKWPANTNYHKFGHEQ